VEDEETEEDEKWVEELLVRSESGFRFPFFIFFFFFLSCVSFIVACFFGGKF